MTAVLALMAGYEYTGAEGKGNNDDAGRNEKSSAEESSARYSLCVLGTARVLEAVV